MLLNSVAVKAMDYVGKQFFLTVSEVEEILCSYRHQIKEIKSKLNHS